MNKVFLLYSQFSTHCKDLIGNFDKLEDINILCIDNPKIRKQVLSCNQYNIKVVPTVIHVSGNDTSIYEGIGAKEFIQNILVNKKSQDNPIIPDSNNMEESVIIENSTILEQSGIVEEPPLNLDGKTTIDDLFDNDSDEEEEEQEEEEEDVEDVQKTEKSLMDRVEEMKRSRADN